MAEEATTKAVDPAQPSEPDGSEAVKKAANELAEARNADVIVYAGDIYAPADERFIDLLYERTNRKNAWLLLTTPGGDPDVGYRIIRALQNRYTGGKITLCVDNECKSTGTLIALGVDELVITEYGHLGPLDVQVRHKDEIWESASGLAPGESLDTLRQRSLDYFSGVFYDLRRKMRFPTRIAVDVASRATIGLFEAIYRQIDPLWLGETQRSMRISSAYGRRLIRDQFVSDASLGTLVAGYPSHGFIIDKEEAKKLFRRVRDETPQEVAFIESTRGLIRFVRSNELQSEPFMAIINDEQTAKSNEGDDNGQVAGRSDPAGEGRAGRAVTGTPPLGPRRITEDGKQHKAAQDTREDHDPTAMLS